MLQHCLLWAAGCGYATTASHGFHVESGGSSGAQRVQTILLHTKDRYHLEPRAWASTFGPAPFLIYSHLVSLDLVWMLQAHRATSCHPSSTVPAHSAAHTAAVPPCRCRPQLARLCYTSPHQPAVVVVLILAPWLSTNLWSRGAHGPCRVWSAVLLGCSALCSRSAPALLAKIVCVCPVQLRLSAVPYLSLSMRSSCGYGCVGIHRRLQNSRPRLSPTQLVAPSSLHP